MQRFVELIPGELTNVSGAVFNSGKDAFARPNTHLYLLGLNPGGVPDQHVVETVAFHTRKVENRPANWCEHRDESWDGRPPGTAGMQPRVLHLLGQLNLDPGLVPSSNLIFERTRSQEDLKGRFDLLAGMCWPMHAAVIKELHIKTVVCFGQQAGNYVRKRLSAHRLLGTFFEANLRRNRCEAYENDDGLSIVVATHPSRFAWNRAASDPSPFIRAVVDRTVGTPLEDAWACPKGGRILKTDGQSNASSDVVRTRMTPKAAASVSDSSRIERDQRLIEIYLASGLSKILPRKAGPMPVNENFSKLIVTNDNPFCIRSIEIYSLKSGAAYLRLHHGPRAPDWMRAALARIQGVRKTPTTSGINFDGDLFAAATSIAAVLTQGG